MDQGHSANQRRFWEMEDDSSGSYRLLDFLHAHPKFLESDILGAIKKKIS